MEKVGIVKSIWRYPVKGMAGEIVDSIEIGPMGIAGDRSMAVQDVERGEIQSCKFRPQLLQCRARYSDPNDLSRPIQLHFPDGEVLNSSDPNADQKISELIQHDSKLQEVRPAEDRDFYRRYKKDEHTWLEELKDTFAREPGEPLPDFFDDLPKEAQEYVSLVGSFFLVSPMHIISTASLKYLSQFNEDADWDIERFRPNIYIETPPELAGLVEQSWIGHSIKLGEVTINCSETAPRCGAVTQLQENVGKDTSILRTIVKEAEQNLGIYGDVIESGCIKAGDAVYLSTS